MRVKCILSIALAFIIAVAGCKDEPKQKPVPEEPAGARCEGAKAHNTGAKAYNKRADGRHRKAEKRCA